jgi:DNA repair photolyase
VLDERQRGTRFIEWQVKSVINSPATTGMGFWSVNPYVGCEFGCTYCYARETHRFAMERTAVRQGARAAWQSGGDADPTEEHLPTHRAAHLPPFEAFERDILVKVNVADVLGRTLDPTKLNGSSLVIGTATDPYQPAERKFELTRKILERLRSYRGLSIGIITKSPLITRDLSLLQQLDRIHEVSVNISLATASTELARKLERRSPVPSARLRALRTLGEGGIHAGLLCAPILPGINDDRAGLATLFGLARAAGAHYACGSALRLDPVLAPRFFAIVDQEFPGLSDRYRSHFSDRYYVTPEYQAALTRRLRSLQLEFGFPVDESMRRRQQLEGRARRAPAKPKLQTTLL